MRGEAGLALRAVISREYPENADDIDALWIGDVRTSDEEEASGVPTAAIVTFIKEAQPGVWFSLDEFGSMLSRVDWSVDQTWTSVSLPEQAAQPHPPYFAALPLSEAVRSFCDSSYRLLVSLNKKNVWVRFE